MIPILFTLGSIEVYSYSLMLGLSIWLGKYLLVLEVKRKHLGSNLASMITILGVLFGIAGAKLLYLMENWNAFLQQPVDMLRSLSGLTWYGGLITGLLAIFAYVRAKEVSFLQIADCLSVGTMLSYGVARLGCHLAGDGDYGFPTDLPWGTNYQNGIYPPSKAFALFPQIARKYPSGVVPDNTPCHPVPVYELLLSILGFLILWYLRKKAWPDGRLFMIYLLLLGTFRFSVEFLRLNPRLLFGLSEAQLISLVLCLVGLVGLTYGNWKKHIELG